MFNIERWQEIFDSMGKNKLQTFLTMVSVFFGIFILVILVGFSSGIENGVRSEFEQDATNRLSVWTGMTTKGYKGLNPGRVIQLRNGDFDEMNRKHKENIEYKSGLYSIWGAEVTYGNQNGNYRVEGAGPDQQFIENATMVSGRFVNQSDMDAGLKIAVLGNQMKQDLFKDEEAVGKLIKVFGINFLVVGVYTDPGGEREENRAFIPVTTAQRVFNAGDKLRSLVYTVKMSEDFDEAVALSASMKDQFENDLKSKHSVAPDDTSAVRVFDTLEEA
ncbi:MAG: putative ABC transport system permease protein, partial [Ulvibacter sp.]